VEDWRMHVESLFGSSEFPVGKKQSSVLLQPCEFPIKKGVCFGYRSRPPQ
jgi:hypothetical protein